MRTMSIIVRRNCRNITLSPNEALSVEVSVSKTQTRMVTLIGRIMLTLRLEAGLQPK